MNFSLSKRQEGSTTGVYWKIIRRTLIIFFLGLFLNAFPFFDFSTLRIPGVLQRIAIVYFFASIIAINVSAKAEAWITGVLLVVYWLLMRFVPVPGYGAGVLTPEGSLESYIDQALLHHRMYRQHYDPEGFMSTIPALATGLLGHLTGYLLRSRLEKIRIAGWMFVLGWLGILAGWTWGIWFPINKNIWTSSYVLFTAGAALEVLAVCYWMIDCHGYRKWFQPLIVFGVNAIALYVLSGIVSDLIGSVIKIHSAAGRIPLKQWIVDNLLAPWSSPMNASLIFGLLYVVFWWLIMDLFYRKRIFIKI